MCFNALDMSILKILKPLLNYFIWSVMWSTEGRVRKDSDFK